MPEDLNDLGDLGRAIQRRIDRETLQLRARLLATEAVMKWQDQGLIDTIAEKIAEILTLCDAAAVGDLSSEEQHEAIEATVRKWNGAGKANGSNGNGAHIQ